LLSNFNASVLFEAGNTKVLASVTLQQGVPPFLKGQRVGWLTAEYAMLPSATHQRTMRESTQNNRNSRSVEISRLIGRSLRPIIDLSILGERTVVIDCDVLQADGGTRVASITAASLALQLAAERWVENNLVEKNVFKEQVAAISAGVISGVPCVDLSYKEDSGADADFNFVMTASGLLIEIQGTCEKAPIAWEVFENIKNLAIQGIAVVVQQCNITQPKHQNAPIRIQKQDARHNNRTENYQDRASKQSCFSLGNRLNKQN